MEQPGRSGRRRSRAGARGRCADAADDDPRRARCSRCSPSSSTTPVIRTVAGGWPRKRSRSPEPPTIRSRSRMRCTTHRGDLDTGDASRAQAADRRTGGTVPLLDDPWMSFAAAERQWIVGNETGDRSQTESALATMRTLAASVPQPSFAWAAATQRVVWALIEGDLQSSEQLATEAFEVGTASGEPDAAIFLAGQLFTIRVHQGRAGGASQNSSPSWPASRAAFLRGGRPPRSR